MVLISRLKSSSTQHDDHFVNYDLIYFKIDNKAGDALGWDYQVIYRSLQWLAFMSCVYVLYAENHKVVLKVLTHLL